MTLQDLHRKVEEASGPDRGLDVDIAWALEPERYGAAYWNARSGLPGTTLPKKLDGLGAIAVQRNCPPFTASVDAALGLVERMLPGWTIARMSQGDNKLWTVELREGFLTSYNRVVIEPSGFNYRGTTLPLAILAALLRALSPIQSGGSDA